MGSEDRIRTITEYVTEKKEVSLRKLCEMFPEVTEMTIRRDLNLLQKKGVLQRVWGGARINEQYIDDVFSQDSRSTHAKAEKNALTDKALSLITMPTSMFLDAGTTTLELARKLPLDIPFFVLTNNPHICMELMNHDNCEVMATGGHLSKSVNSFTGEAGLHMFDEINIDIAFLGAVGVSSYAGFTNAHRGECLIKQKAISSAATKVMLVDSSKMNVVLAYRICNFDDIDIIVTDAAPPEEIQKACDEADVKVIF